MGLFDGAFGGGGQGILPDWLFNPQLMQNNPNAIGAPDSFADKWAAASALPPMQTAPQTQGGGIFGGLGYEPMGWSGGGGGANPALVAAMNSQAPMRPDINPYNAGDEGGMPPAAQPTMGRAQGGAMPSALGGLPIPDGLSSFNMPSGNPLAGLLATNGQQPQQSGYQSPFGSFDPFNRGGPLSSAGDWINNNRTGIALFGAGLAGGGGKGNWNAGLSDALRGLAQGGQVDQQQQSQLQSQNAAYQAVKAAGGTEAQALAARSNPEVFKAIAPELFGGWKLVKTGSNPITGDAYEMQGPGGKLMSLDEFRRRGAGQEASSGPAGGVPGGSGMLAPGVKQYDPTLTGDPYLAQFAPEVQAAVKAYMNGDVLPTGNPRLQGIAAVAKMIAQKYGQDIGQPVSDALYSEKRKYRTELGSTSPSSAGGQAKSFTQGIEHSLALGGELKKLENWNGFGIPLVAATANTIRQGMSNEQSAIADKAAGIGQTLAGEVGKLFSGSAGGGVHEREMTRARFGTVRSRPQLAAALEATLETMEGGLTALEARRDAVMGPNSGVELIPQQTRDKIDKLRGIIEELKGGGQTEGKSKPGVVKWEVGPNGVPRPVSK